MDKRPLIAIDFAFFDHSNIGAGQYRYVVQICLGFADKKDFRFLIIGSQAKPVPELQHLVETYPNWDYASLPHHSYPLNDLAYHLRYSFLLWRRGAKLFHATHVFVPVLAHCPVVMTKHDLMEELFDEYTEVRTHRPYRMHKWATRKKVEKVISISQQTHDDLIQYFQINPDKSTIIHHGIDHDQPMVQPGFMIDPDWQPYLNNQSPWILGPYNLEPRKNLIGLCRALPELVNEFPDIRLVLFGNAALTPERVEQFESEIRSLGVEQLIHRVGFVSDPELTWLYHHARVFVFSTFYEGFGYPIIEAMSAGGCVISGTNSSMGELMSDIGIGVDVSKPGDIANAVSRLIQNPDLRESLAEKGMAWSQTFTLKKVVEKTFNTYLDAMGKG